MAAMRTSAQELHRSRLHDAMHNIAHTPSMARMTHTTRVARMARMTTRTHEQVTSVTAAADVTGSATKKLQTTKKNAMPPDTAMPKMKLLNTMKPPAEKPLQCHQQWRVLTFQFTWKDLAETQESIVQGLPICTQSM